MPFQTIQDWLEEEHQSGAPNPNHAVLSSVGAEQHAHARVVAIKEITEKGFLFFTQKGTRKVSEMREHPHVSLTFWLEIKQRQIIVEGEVTELDEQETLYYWESYPREAQIRFHSYAPTSAKAIPNKAWLNARKVEVEKQFSDDNIPISPDYWGFRVLPNRIAFYAYRTDTLSDTFEFLEKNGVWEKQWLSP